MTLVRTGTDHGPCLTHRRYALTCQQYELLVAECNNLCPTCGKHGSQASRGRLVIDHDARIGSWAVRGLICDACNGQLRVDRPDPQWGKAYLENPWFERMLAELGVPIECPAEPLESRVWVRDFNGRAWRRQKSGLWETGHKSIKPHTWEDLYFRFGPHNLTVRRPVAAPTRTRAPSPMTRIRTDSAWFAAKTLRRHMTPETCRELARLLLEE